MSSPTSSLSSAPSTCPASSHAPSASVSAGASDHHGGACHGHVAHGPPPPPALPPDGYLERLAQQHKLQLLDLFQNGRMFALGLFLDTVVAHTKLTLDTSALDIGTQLHDNARRLDAGVAGMQDGINGNKSELRATGPAVQQGLSSLGEGLMRLHDAFEQTSADWQRLNTRLDPLDQLPTLATIPAVLAEHNARVTEHSQRVAALEKLLGDLHAGRVADGLRNAVVSSIQDTVRETESRNVAAQQLPDALISAVLALQHLKHEQAVEQERNVHILEMQNQRYAHALEQRALLKSSSSDPQVTGTSSITQSDVQKVLDLQQEYHRHTKTQLAQATKRRDETASKLDDVAKTYLDFRTTHQAKEQRMDTRLRELTHILMVIVEKTDISSVDITQDINHPARKVLGLRCHQPDADHVVPA